MPRLRQVPRAEVHDRGRPIYDMLFGDRCPVAEPGTATGSPGNWWTVFAGVPDCFDHAVQGFAFYRSPNRTIDPKLRELGSFAPATPGAAASSSRSTARRAAMSASARNRSRQFLRGRWRPVSRRLNARCWPTPIVWCSKAAAYPTWCSKRYAGSSMMRRSSSSPTSPACTRCTPPCAARCGSSSTMSTTQSLKCRRRMPAGRPATSWEWSTRPPRGGGRKTPISVREGSHSDR